MTLKMKGDVLDELVKRLRSGKYKQGHSALRRVGEGDGPDTFCCLGVMCEMAVEEGVITREPQMHRLGGVSYSYRDGDSISTSYLPQSVVDWAGIESDVEKHPDMGDYYYEERGTWGDGRYDALSVMNDNGMPFDEIADWMVANVERV